MHFLFGMAFHNFNHELTWLSHDLWHADMFIVQKKSPWLEYIEFFIIFITFNMLQNLLFQHHLFHLLFVKCCSIQINISLLYFNHVWVTVNLYQQYCRLVICSIRNMAYAHIRTMLILGVLTLYKCFVFAEVCPIQHRLSTFHGGQFSFDTESGIPTITKLHLAIYYGPNLIICLIHWPSLPYMCTKVT